MRMTKTMFSFTDIRVLTYILKELLNIITNEVICAETSKELGKLIKRPTAKVNLILNKKQDVLGDIYIHPENDKVFILVSKEEKEYKCIDNKTIFIHLKLPFNLKESKKIDNLKNKKHFWTKICNLEFYLKSNPPSNSYLFSDDKLPIEIRRIPYFRSYYQKNKTKIYDKAKIYRINNKNKINERTRKRQMIRRQDPEFRLKSNLRSRLSRIMKGEDKSNRFKILLGCSFDEARKHIESLWKEGMTWGNYGLHGWHIDHIRPVSSFDLVLESEQKLCFHYSNLQPLWATENFKKSNKVFS